MLTGNKKPTLLAVNAAISKPVLSYSGLSVRYRQQNLFLLLGRSLWFFLPGSYTSAVFLLYPNGSHA